MKEQLKNLKLDKVLDLLIWARINGASSQFEFNRRADAAYKQANEAGYPEMIFIIMSHIGDISRFHNVYRTIGVTSKDGGAGEYESFRKLMNWLINKDEKLASDYYKWAQEFTQYSIGWFYQNTTDRKSGKLLKTEKVFFPESAVFTHIRAKLMKGENIAIIARQLPKYVTGRNRYNKDENGIITKRKVQDFTHEKRAEVNGWIKRFCKAMVDTPYFEKGTIKEYRNFRKLQNSIEQKVSSKILDSYSMDELFNIFDHCPAGQRSRLHGLMKNPETKFPNAAKAYNEWMDIQKKASTMTKAERNEAGIKLTIKSTGMKTIDIFNKMVTTGDTDEADALWKSLIEKQRHNVPVFPIIDGSGSMDTKLEKYPDLSVRDAAYAMAITFATQNPNEELRNSYGWFSKDFHVINNETFRYENTSYWNRMKTKVKPYQVLSDKFSFSQNLVNLRKASPREISYTDQVTVVEYFVKMVNENKLRIEELPKVLLFLTDNEFNGRYNSVENVERSKEVAASIGWYPLQVLWGLRMSQDSFPFSHIDNCIGLGGFNEGILGQIFGNIMSVYVDPYTELWSLVKDERYKMFHTPKLNKALDAYFSEKLDS